MAKQVMESRLADKVCLELTAVIKRKNKHDDRTEAGMYYFFFFPFLMYLHAEIWEYQI